ncbi:hypothetical protein Rhe02_87300 [Rhizocola hellebori]|uniref:Uncharacterized protein n=1 Tax=Rhizocola hellebori TaxID=1392758 RepID=A0A8J3VLY7_9ACTN|nr:hypothetical protein [Rhizocola hellebori]GIH10663.1 hypothetical protein Rhe02_87300 [Rhizocola hellebori]
MRFVALLAGLLLAAATAAACGSSEPETTPVAASFQDCLRQEGIDVSGLGQGGARASGQPFTRPSGQPGGGFPSGRPTAFPSGRPTAFPSGRPGNGFNFGDQAPAGVDPAKWQAALAKCGSLRPSGGVRPNGSARPGGGNGRQQAYLNCMSEHGVTVTQGQPLPTSDPKVADAEKVCAVLRPSAPAQ